MKQQNNKTQSLVKESTRFIHTHVKSRPKVAVILGSGLGDFVEVIDNKTIIETNSIPNYPRSTVEGHRGNLILGRIGKTNLLIFQGRVHYYESGNLESTLYPIRIAHALGIKILIVTNAAGGINTEFKPGDLMIISDQINLTFENPLRNIQPLRRSSPLYDFNFQRLTLDIANKNSIPIKHGIYCGIKGPSYETAAEVEMIRRLGADAVGMSTVNEVSLAAALGIRVVGISCITNLSTGITDQKLSHQEVTEVANQVKQSFSDLLIEIIKSIKV